MIKLKKSRAVKCDSFFYLFYELKMNLFTIRIYNTANPNGITGILICKLHIVQCELHKFCSAIHKHR